MKQATLLFDAPDEAPRAVEPPPAVGARWMCPACGHVMTEEQSKGYRRCPTGVHFVQHVLLAQGQETTTPVRMDSSPPPHQAGDNRSQSERNVNGSAPVPASSDATKAPAGPRSKAARIVHLARALGVQSDAEAAGQLNSNAPF